MKGLVLAGGGSKGVIELGVLRTLLDQNPELDYNVFSGISSGALNASILATGSLKETLPKLEKIWLEDIKGNESIWKNHILWYLLLGIGLIIAFVIAAFLTFILHTVKSLTIGLFILAFCALYIPFYSLKNSKSVYVTHPLRKLIEKNLDLEKLRNNNKTLRVGACCYETGEYRLGKETDHNIIDWIMASSAFPVFFPMIEIEDKNWLDGGILNIVDIQCVINLGCTQIDVILTSPIDQSTIKQTGLLNELERSLDLMGIEILSNDIITLCKDNINIRVFMPTKAFNVSALDFDPKNIKEMYEAGKKIALKNINV